MIPLLQKVTHTLSLSLSLSLSLTDFPGVSRRLACFVAGLVGLSAVPHARLLLPLLLSSSLRTDCLGSCPNQRKDRNLATGGASKKTPRMQKQQQQQQGRLFWSFVLHLLLPLLAVSSDLQTGSAGIPRANLLHKSC